MSTKTAAAKTTSTAATSTDDDDFFLPGVSFTVDGETLPARDCAWARFASCGCVAGLHMMTEDAVTEAAAWKQMVGNAQMIKRARARGFTIRMVKHRDVPFDDCPHWPRWGYTPPPTPPGHSWATTDRVRALHLVPLSVDKEKDKKDQDRWAWEWVEAEEDWRTKFTSICGKVSVPAGSWTRKWYHIDGKVECARCVKLAQAQALL